MTKAKVTFPSAPDTSAIDIEDEGSLIVSNPTAMNFTGPGVTVTENPTGTAEVDIPGLQYWTESEDAATQQSTIFTPNNSATDVNAVLLPKGNGANLAQTPDGTTTGGNARGQYATDWQKRRTNADQVASGNDSTISGGRNNRAANTDATIGGGSGNLASGTGATIPGGRNNNATNTDSFASGSGNTSSGLNSFVHGRGATASGTDAVAIGERAIASSPKSVAIGELPISSAVRATAFQIAKSDQIGFLAHTGRQRSGGSINGDRQKEEGLAIGQFTATAAGQTFVAEISSGVNYSIQGIVAIYIVELTYILQNRTSSGTFSGNDVFLGKEILFVKSDGANLTLGTPTSLYSYNDAIMAGAAFTIGSSGTGMTFTFTSPTATLATGNLLEGTVLIKSLRTF